LGSPVCFELCCKLSCHDSSEPGAECNLPVPNLTMRLGATDTLEGLNHTKNRLAHPRKHAPLTAETFLPSRIPGQEVSLEDRESLVKMGLLGGTTAERT